jgi:hypothetical protein
VNIWRELWNLTNSMGQKPKWEADTSPVILKLRSVLWKSKIQYQFHKSTFLLWDTQIQSTPSQACLFKTPFCIRLPSMPVSSRWSGFPTKILYDFLISSSRVTSPRPSYPPSSDLFPSRFPTKILYVFLIRHTFYKFCPFNPPSFDNPNIFWWREQFIMLPIVQFSPPNCYFVSFRSSYPVWNTRNPYFPLTARD